MKHLKLFEDFYYSGKEESNEVCPDCDCSTCECDDKMEWEYDENYPEESEEKFGEESEEFVGEAKKSKKSKPDFLDLDKDGNKKESMKKAAKDAKEGKSDKKDDKKLSAAQRKLPAGLQAAIARKAAKSKPKD